MSQSPGLIQKAHFTIRLWLEVPSEIRRGFISISRSRVSPTSFARSHSQTRTHEHAQAGGSSLDYARTQNLTRAPIFSLATSPHQTSARSEWISICQNDGSNQKFLILLFNLVQSRPSAFHFSPLIFFPLRSFIFFLFFRSSLSFWYFSLLYFSFLVFIAF